MFPTTFDVHGLLLLLSQGLYESINAHGAADHMIFYGQQENASTTKPRSAIFRGINGLFFCLVAMRTGLPVVAVSSLFGASEQTGGRAFTTWVTFLYGALRPFVRLPEVDEVWSSETGSTAPSNFKNRGMGKVVIILDATEIETFRVWHTDLAYYIFSPYKKRPTGKLLIGVTPGGSICFISHLYGGRISDTELVHRSGVIQELESKGFGGCEGYQVMADRGFNAIGVQLLEIGMSLVAPPWSRQGEEQFQADDAKYTQEVANVRIHVERAIGALKEWKICETKFCSTRMDIVSTAVCVCGALVNMLNEPFVSNLH